MGATTSSTLAIAFSPGLFAMVVFLAFVALKLQSFTQASSDAGKESGENMGINISLIGAALFNVLTMLGVNAMSVTVVP
ncbi:hypothetical protein [Comamonas sp. CMM02]|uniref:hypothetical protein n=1 Tax=Comamonas sp. CMM02 TaxID=2769307 RepID=UPI0017809DC6|nr:hypothetical protein [Comamonas sp. CMM02]MBD9402800.1 hypothetical protein [Comamonas sp. CMM02]